MLQGKMKGILICVSKGQQMYQEENRSINKWKGIEKLIIQKWLKERLLFKLSSSRRKTQKKPDQLMWTA